MKTSQFNQKKIFLLITGIIFSLVLAIYNQDAFAEDDGSVASENLSENAIFTKIDENGNIVEMSESEINESGIIDETEQLSASQSKKKTNQSISTYSSRSVMPKDDILYQRGVVNFRTKSSSQNTLYTEEATGREGYTNGCYAADGAYLGHNASRTKVKFMLSGVIGWVNASDVEVLDFSDNAVQTLSKYYVSDGRLIHGIVTNLKNKYYSNKIDVGPKPSYLKEGETYYSYDGHYFYSYNNTKGYTTMLQDYRNDTRKNSVNPQTPYYNYYQFLSHRSKSIYTAKEIDQAINKKTVSSSKMRNLGHAYVDNQNKYGINAMMVLGVSANESAWGTSSIAQTRNNLFGHAAYDSDPSGSANKYSTPAFSVYYHASNFLSKQYCYPKNWKYNGSYLGDKASGINVKYASDPYWGEKAATFAWAIDKELGNKDAFRYTIGVKNPYNYKASKANIKKDKKDSSTTLYQTMNTAKEPLTNYAFININNEKKNNYYKIQSDSILDSSRSTITNKGEYSFSRDYAYIDDEDVVIISKGKTDPIEEKPEVKYLKGDIDGDGAVEANDYMLIKLHVLGRKKLSGDALKRADVDGDGSIEANDYMLVKLHVLGRKKLF